MKIFIENELKNVARRFNRAIWRKYEVNRYYSSAKEAKKFHNLKNCNYYYHKEGEDGNDVIISNYYNGMMDAYGNRM